MSPGNQLNRQGSAFAIGQEQRSPLTQHGHSNGVVATVETIVKSKLQDREVDQLIINLGKEPVKVREQGEKVIKFILWSNDIVSRALSAQPLCRASVVGSVGSSSGKLCPDIELRKGRISLIQHYSTIQYIQNKLINYQ